MYNNCYYCGHRFGLLEARYGVKRAIKPPYSYKRWGHIGDCCEDCVDKHSPIDPWSKSVKGNK